MTTATKQTNRRAGAALKAVIREYGLSQNKVAAKMGYARSTVNQWVNQSSDPLSDSIPDIFNALEDIEEGAGRKFISIFLNTHSPV